MARWDCYGTRSCAPSMYPWDFWYILITFPHWRAQFVAMKLGHGYTIEEQLAKTTNGGIQIDVFPSLDGVVTFTHEGGRPLDLGKSPRQLGIKPNDRITLDTSYDFEYFFSSVTCPDTHSVKYPQKPSVTLSSILPLIQSLKFSAMAPATPNSS